VDAEVQLPADAQPRIYASEVAFQSTGVEFEKHLTFVLQSH
jgi:hypothetical protein